jgi:hypothetical protein
LFIPDRRHRDNQKYCLKSKCRQARQAVNLRRWRDDPLNQGFWRGSWNGDRVRAWRAANPGYWKRKRKGAEAPLQIASKPAEAPVASRDQAESTGDCVTNRIPALLLGQSPVLVGLIAQMTGTALQNAILQIAGELFEKGQAVLGNPTPGQNENCKSSLPTSGAAATSGHNPTTLKMKD